MNPERLHLTIKKQKHEQMKQIGNSNEDMLALLEAVVGIKNELLYIREYFHPLLKGEIYLSGEQVCEMLHISKRTLQRIRPMNYIFDLSIICL